MPKRKSSLLFYLLIGALLASAIFPMLLLMGIPFRTSETVLIIVVISLMVVGLGVGLLYYLTESRGRGPRTVRDVKIGKRVREVKEDALGWLKEKGFKIVEKRGGFIQAMKGRRGLMKIHFELMLKGKNGRCSLHGEFYAKDFKGSERDLRETSLWGQFFRKRGFKLMNEFLDYLKKGD